MNPALQGLYAITPQRLCDDPPQLYAACAAALRGGARLLQYRDKRSLPAQRLLIARTLAALCRQHAALFIVNDDVTTAHAAGADGVHLGAADAPLAAARRVLGANAVIGASCGPDLERALSAQAAGAGYVAFGRFFASRTKPDAPPAALELLSQARAMLRIPICAIGGLAPDNAAAAIAAGTDMIAAVEGVFGAGDPEAAARRYAQLFAASPSLARIHTADRHDPI